jgi:DNA mismatch repair ATPase MutS
MSETHFSHKIKNIKEHIKTIDYIYNDGNKGPHGSHAIVLTTCKNTKYTKYIFKIAGGIECCEKIGCFFSENEIGSSARISARLSTKLAKTVAKYISKDIDTEIDNIHIYETSDIFQMVMEINLVNKKKINFIMYNDHNGYYPHRVWLDVYENGDSKPIRVVNTAI